MVLWSRPVPQINDTASFTFSLYIITRIAHWDRSDNAFPLSLSRIIHLSFVSIGESTSVDSSKQAAAAAASSEIET